MPRIAIPHPHSANHEYSERVRPHYADAVRMVGGEPVEVPLDLDNTAIMRIASECDCRVLITGVANFWGRRLAGLDVRRGGVNRGAPRHNDRDCNGATHG